jgi:hypothetical protein
MPSDTIVTQYRTLIRSWNRWLDIQRDATTLALYNRAGAHIDALCDAMFDLECEYPTIVRMYL